MYILSRKSNLIITLVLLVLFLTTRLALSQLKYRRLIQKNENTWSTYLNHTVGVKLVLIEVTSVFINFPRISSHAQKLTKNRKNPFKK
jgi:hypothetical protein